MSNPNLSNRFKGKRVAWTDEEIEIVLGYYYFIYLNNTRKRDYYIFANHLRNMTGNERTNDSVGVRFGNFISIDPAKKSSGFKGGNTKCIPIWKKCINEDRTPKESFILKFSYFVEEYGDNSEIYSDFIEKYSNYISVDQTLEETIESYNNDVANRILKKVFNKELLINEGIKDLIINQSVIRRRRSPDVAAYTRSRANGICDLCGRKAPFVDNNGIPFLESHHLITLAQGGPDVIFNTVALCPNCHRKMHIIDSEEDKEFLKKVLYKYLLTDEEKEVVEKFEKLFAKE